MAALKAEKIFRHIGSQLKLRRGMKGPLIVGVQGPQGSGKTTVTAAVQATLEREGRRTAVFSIDDLYLPHSGLEELKQKFPYNRLLHGRGQPGTHDMALGTQLLEQLKANADGQIVNLPIFDKSLFAGEGDRSDKTTDVRLPLDVVIFEGWCLGFYPIDEATLSKKYEEQADSESEKHFFREHSLDSLREVNEFLRQYVYWYKHIDAFVLLKPDHLHNVFAWRLQAEHAMKASGKTGMTDEQVHTFVARYMPGYELFGQGPTRHDTPWHGKGLKLELNKERDLICTSYF